MSLNITKDSVRFNNVRQDLAPTACARRHPPARAIGPAAAICLVICTTSAQACLATQWRTPELTVLPAQLAPAPDGAKSRTLRLGGAEYTLNLNRGGYSLVDASGQTVIAGQQAERDGGSAKLPRMGGSLPFALTGPWADSLRDSGPPWAESNSLCIVPEYVITPLGIIYTQQVNNGDIARPDFWMDRVQPFWMPFGLPSPLPIPKEFCDPNFRWCMNNAREKKDSVDDKCAEAGVAVAIAGSPVLALAGTAACLWASARYEEHNVMQCVAERANCLGRP